MEILRWYRMGQNMARLIDHHWYNQHFVSKASRFLGMDFGTGRGFTQGKPASPIILNIVVDEVLRAVLNIVCGPQELRHWMFLAAG